MAFDSALIGGIEIQLMAPQFFPLHFLLLHLPYSLPILFWAKPIGESVLTINL